MKPLILVTKDGDEYPLASRFPLSLASLDGKLPVKFAGCSGEGEVYEDHRGRLFLIRTGQDHAERLS